MGVVVIEEQRLATLRSFAILDTPGELQFDLIVRTIARLFAAPIALVSLVDADRQWFKARIGVARHETPRAESFCVHAIEGEDMMIVPDAHADPRFRDHPAVLGDPFVRFYAGAPLRMPDGANIGALCVIDTRPRTGLPPAALTFLEVMARHTAAAIGQRAALPLRATA